MKKYIKILAVIFTMVLALNLFTVYASAEEDLYIKDWIVAADLIENGDLQISEDITFVFNDSYNGVFRDIVLDKTDGVSDVMVQELSKEATREYSLAEKAKNGDSGVYTLQKDNGKAVIKIFSPSEDENKTFRISYIVHNVAVKYNDIGELYYKFLGKENKTTINSFIVNINLPQEYTENQVKVFAHGPLNGTINKLNDNSYQLKVMNVSSKTYIEGRLLFPTEYIAGSKNIKAVDGYNKIIEEENALQNRIDKERERREKRRETFERITLLASGISILAFAIILYQCRRKINRDSIYKGYRSIPEDCTPAVAALIIGMISSGNVIFATILDLLKKGYLRISGEDEEIDVTKNEYFTIHKTKKPDMFLLEHEKYFMNWLFDDLGDGESVSTKDFEYHSKNSGTRFYTSLGEWRKKVKEDAVSKGYYDKSKETQGLILIILSCSLIVLGIITAVMGSAYSIIDIAVGIVLMICGISLFYRLSDSGYERYKKWILFKKNMWSHVIDTYKEDELKSLDSSLIYALAFNVKGKKKHMYYTGMENSYSMNSWIFWYWMFAASNNNSLNKSINNSFVYNISSSSGGGGFSGGGGGGAGGGGAGGF